MRNKNPRFRRINEALRHARFYPFICLMGSLSEKNKIENRQEMSAEDMIEKINIATIIVDIFDGETFLYWSVLNDV
jgi:hypothetical protein